MSRFAMSGWLSAAFLMLVACGAAEIVAQDGVKKGDAKDEKKADSKSDSKDDPKAESKAEPKKVYRSVTTEKLEGVLKEMKIDFERGKSKDEGVAVYTFEMSKRSIRLQNFGGKDLWIDTEFSDKLTPEMVNEWNVRAKFSRAVRLKGEKGIVSLESQLDCVGGVTDAHIRQFIGRFDGEMQQFSKFTRKLVDVKFEDDRPDQIRKEVR